MSQEMSTEEEQFAGEKTNKQQYSIQSGNLDFLEKKADHNGHKCRRPVFILNHTSVGMCINKQSLHP